MTNTIIGLFNGVPDLILTATLCINFFHYSNFTGEEIETFNSGLFDVEASTLNSQLLFNHNIRRLSNWDRLDRTKGFQSGWSFFTAHCKTSLAVTWLNPFAAPKPMLPIIFIKGCYPGMYPGGGWEMSSALISLWVSQ